MTKKTSRNAVKKINKQLDQLLKEKKELENTTILKKAEVEKIKKDALKSETNQKKKVTPKKETIVVEDRKNKAKEKDEIVVPTRKESKRKEKIKTETPKRSIKITQDNKNKLKKTVIKKTEENKEEKKLEDKVNDLIKDIDKNEENDKSLSDILDISDQYLKPKTITVSKKTKEKLKKVAKKDNSIKKKDGAGSCRA